MSKEYAVLGRVVLPGKTVEDGAVVVSGGIITFSGSRADATLPKKVIDTAGKIIGPGFVDIHCHAGGGYLGYENPAQTAAFHRKHGTTGILLTLYRDLNHDRTLEALNRIKQGMRETPTILGAHMEGPYLNPKYGSKKTDGDAIDRDKYGKYIDTGIVRQWTYAPEQPGSAEFLKDITAAGIVPALGHSAASPEQIFDAVKGGAKIITHVFNATGCSITPTRYGGTLEVSFDMAAMLCDDIFYEVICDREGIHVRPDMVRLLAKAVGKDKIVAITDCFAAPGEGDVNIENGSLTGTRLTMDNAARNLLALGNTVEEVFSMTAYNPARAINMQQTVGSLLAGRRADIIVTDETLSTVEVLEI